MKTIKPIQSWVNGESVTATILDLYAGKVILGTAANFYYFLLDENFVSVAQGNLEMSGEDYSAWEQDSYAWDWVASKLNLIITGDYVPPMPPITEITEPNN